MGLSEKPTKAFPFSLAAGILILINAAALGVVARWDPGFMPKLPGSSGTDPMLLHTLSAVGLFLGLP